MCICKNSSLSNYSEIHTNPLVQSHTILNEFVCPGIAPNMFVASMSKRDMCAGAWPRSTRADIWSLLWSNKMQVHTHSHTPTRSLTFAHMQYAHVCGEHGIICPEHSMHYSLADSPIRIWLEGEKGGLGQGAIGAVAGACSSRRIRLWCAEHALFSFDSTDPTKAISPFGNITPSSSSSPVARPALHLRG